MPRTEAQNQEIRKATRDAVVSSAMALFARNGYATTTVRQIAEHAGISAGLMYHYFDSKERLLEAVFDNCIVIIDQAFVDATQRATPQQRLAELLQTIYAMLAAEPDFWGLFYMMRTQPAIMEILGDAFRMWTGRLRQLFILDLQALGSQDPEMDALLLYSVVEGTIQQYLLDPANYPLAAVWQRIVNDFTWDITTGEQSEPVSS